MQIFIFFIGLIFIYWFISQLEWQQVSIFLAKIDMGEMGIWVAINLLLFALFCVRSWVIFRQIHSSISFTSLAKNRLVGLPLATLLPAHLWEENLFKFIC